MLLTKNSEVSALVIKTFIPLKIRFGIILNTYGFENSKEPNAKIKLNTKAMLTSGKTIILKRIEKSET